MAGSLANPLNLKALDRMVGTDAGADRMMEWAKFAWNATRGHRFTPWRSPYVLWRMETYTGMKAETVRLSDLLGLVWAERFQMLRFLRWLGAMRQYQQR